MSADALERTFLRLLAPVLPKKLRDPVRLLAVKPPPTPQGTVAVEPDPGADRLQKIDHIVVLMLENRSFDHMLGYLSLENGRSDIDGLKDGMSNAYEGKTYPVHHLDRTKLNGEAEDPGHSGHDVREQLSNKNGGFAANYAKHAANYVAKHPGPMPDPGLVMGYYNAEDLPVYDFLAQNFMVCDHWFSSVPGATWPNRLYAVAGKAAGSRDDVKPPFYNLPTFFRLLDRSGVPWRWYSFDPASLRAIDPHYRFSNHHRFSYFDRRKLSVKERAVGELLEEGPSFLDDVANDHLPALSWIDPHFKDFGMLGPDSNDDHPPSDVTAGQDLVLTLYSALRRSPAWEKTLLVITYDEHGGFFDHVQPPPAADDDPEFRQYGVRVPALLVSPWVEAAGNGTQLDHTSIIKTTLLRFCQEGGRIPDIGKRVNEANHLGTLLRDTPRQNISSHGHLAERMTEWRTEWATARFTDPASKANAPRRLNDLQDGVAEASRLLRAAGLPAGHP